VNIVALGASMHHRRNHLFTSRMSLRLTGFRDGNHNASPTDELLQGGAQLDDLVIPDNHTGFLRITRRVSSSSSGSGRNRPRGVSGRSKEVM